MRLVLPGMCLLRAAASMQVMDEQCRHERLGGSGFEDLEAEPGRACVRRRQHPVFGDRPGTSRRGDVHGYGRAAVTGDGGTPALHTLGEGIVGALLGHQAVADAGIGTRRVGGAEQPPAGQSPQRPAAELGRAGPRREGADGLGDRIRRDGEHVGGRREERERDVTAFGLQAQGQRVDGAGDADIGRAVGVDVVAEYQRAIHAGQPVGDGRDVTGQVDARMPRSGPRRPQGPPRLRPACRELPGRAACRHCAAPFPGPAPR